MLRQDPPLCKEWLDFALKDMLPVFVECFSYRSCGVAFGFNTALALYLDAKSRSRPEPDVDIWSCGLGGDWIKTFARQPQHIWYMLGNYGGAATGAFPAVVGARVSCRGDHLTRAER